MNIIEAIKERRSVRSFASAPLSAEVKDELMQAIGSVENPFGGRFTIRLKEFDLERGFKPSTYGMIRGARNFFTMGIAEDEMSALAAGYGFEQVVLKAWQLGLGTCWIAATFKGTDFDSGEPWPEGESLKIVCPVGYPVKKSFVEKLTRFAVGSNRRKPFSELFFADNFSRPLSPDSKFGESLEMMRLAPSSTNSQPWRALVDGDTVHFYYVRKSAASVLDCGIGLCHFHASERFHNHKGVFFRADSVAEKSGFIYLLSYRESLTSGN